MFLDNSVILGVIAGIGTLQGFLFALLLLAKKGRQRPDRVLFTWFLVFSLHLLAAMGKYLYPGLFPFPILIMTLGFLHGPFFLLYYAALVNRKWHLRDSLHFLPFLVFGVLCFYYSPNFPPSWDLVILFPKIASLMVYPSLVLYLSNQRKECLRQDYAGNLVLALGWIRIIAFLFLISIGVGILRMTVALSVGVRYFELWDIIRYVVLLTAIGYFGLRYGMVYAPELAYVPKAQSNYKYSPLKKNEIERYAATITDFLDTNEAYLDADFSLSMLSNSVNIPKHHLSQIINAEMNTSFYSLINSKRVAHAIQKLKVSDKANYTLEAIGYESGFNSKSAFFHNFKKVTGKTPKQFLKEIGSS